MPYLVRTASDVENKGRERRLALGEDIGTSLHLERGLNCYEEDGWTLVQVIEPDNKGRMFFIFHKPQKG